MVGGIAGDKVCEKRKLYTRDEYDDLVDPDWPYDDDSISEDEHMLAMVDQWFLEPQRNVANDSESDSYPLIEHVGIFVDDIRRDNLYSSGESTDSESTHSPDRASENDWGLDTIVQFVENLSRNSQSSDNQDRISESVDITSENARSSEIISRCIGRNSQNPANSVRNSQNSASSDRNSEHRESADGNFQVSDGIELERLREIISSQDRPTNSLGHIAELRRNCLRDDD